jgi:YVTN family beta-propeller protein
MAKASKACASSKKRVPPVPRTWGPGITKHSILLLTLLTLTACHTHEFPQYPPNFREYAYVTNGQSNTVTVLDVVNLRLDREIAVGQNPVAVAPSPTLHEVYVVNSGTEPTSFINGVSSTSLIRGVGSVSVINAETNTVTATIPVHLLPVAIAIDATGTLAYVANAGSNTVSVLELKTRREVAQIVTGEDPGSPRTGVRPWGGEPVALRISPDGKTLVVANHRGNSVTIVDLTNVSTLSAPIDSVRRPSTRAVRATIDGCPGASDVVILPDSSKAFVSCSAGHQVMAIALARQPNPTKPDEPSGSATDHLETLMDVGQGPVQLALKPDGGELFVSNSLSDTISEVVTSKDDVGGAYAMGDDPVRGLVSADNATLYIANFRSQWVTVYAPDEGRRIDSIHVGDGPSALALSNNGLFLFVVDTRSGDISIVRTDTRKLLAMLPAGRAPNAIAVKSFKLP